MVFQDPILAGATLVRDGIQSEGYVAGSAGWRINRDGSAEFNTGTFRGSVRINGVAGTVTVDQNGLVAVATNGSEVDVLTGSAATIQMYPPTVAGTTWDAGVVRAGAISSTKVPYTEIQAPQAAAAGNWATVRLYGASPTSAATKIRHEADNAVFVPQWGGAGVAILTGNGTNGIAVCANDGTPETLQPIVFANGWANQGNGAPGQPAPFRAVLAAAPRRHVAISGVLNGPANGGLSVGNVPAAYAPKYRQPVMCYASVASGVPFFVIEPSGAITPVGVGASSSVWVSGLYPLD